MKELTITYLQEDQTYRLTSSNGSGSWNGVSRDYSMSMSYSPSGRIDSKYMASKRLSNEQGAYNVDYRNEYSYGFNNNPYALKHIEDPNTGETEDFDCDSKGNMRHHISSTNERSLCWTEDNRLQAFIDNKNTAYYNYDASGERNLKMTGGVVQVMQNGTPYSYHSLETPTLYASGLITINEKGYTKHYFEEGKRICSKIGGGFRYPVCSLSDTVEGPLTPYNTQRGLSENGVITTFNDCMGKDVIEQLSNKIYKIMFDHERYSNDPEYTF